MPKPTTKRPPNADMLIQRSRKKVKQPTPAEIERMKLEEKMRKEKFNIA